MDRDEKEAEQDYAGEADSQPAGGDVKPSVIKSGDSSRDENVPPAGRKRTHSESLRLHSLAAEALVAMPMRMPELPASGAKVNLTPNVKLLEAGKKASDRETAAALLNLELHGEVKEEEDLCPLAAGDDESPSTKAGISMSLLTVIERLRERSDQNASDEDILKELRDNAQFQRGALAGVVTENGAESYMCSIPGADGLLGAPRRRLGGLHPRQRAAVPVPAVSLQQLQQGLHQAAPARAQAEAAVPVSHL
ncbi:Zinc finger protein 507 [Oryzias melastigma]|uniref:Zinc finger protein 507 n=1 Tax=Oryzias melastigma TaxID=30732 RepID=A0A834L2J3_ORYME|nr:Zinc finger protein 507 [Oryzias melastigma]